MLSQLNRLSDPSDVPQKDIQRLIDALKVEHEYMYQLEKAYKLFMTVKNRTEKFYAMEFCNTNASTKDVVLMFPFDVPAALEKKYSAEGKDHEDK